MKLIFAALSQALTRSALCALVAIALAANVAQANDNSNLGGDADRHGRCGDSRSGHDSGNRADNLEVVGLTIDHRLIFFDEKRPKEPTTFGKIFGLSLVSSRFGINFRPANGVFNDLATPGVVYTLGL